MKAQFYTSTIFGLVAAAMSVLAVFDTLFFTLPSEEAQLRSALVILMVVLAVVLILFSWFFLNRIDKVEETIEGLKAHFLSKQTPPKTDENQRSTSNAQQSNWRNWIKETENKALVITIIGLCITAGFTTLNTYREWNPPAPRAKLTIYIEYPEFMRVSNNTVTDVTVSIVVVNDSPISATIMEWNLNLNYNVTYQILNRTEKSGNLTLLPSAQTYFTINTTLEGQNHTILPDTDIRSVIFTLSYQDIIGIQEATREYGFL